jgi:hypothetical protein
MKNLGHRTLGLPHPFASVFIRGLIAHRKPFRPRRGRDPDRAYRWSADIDQLILIAEAVGSLDEDPAGGGPDARQID